MVVFNWLGALFFAIGLLVGLPVRWLCDVLGADGAIHIANASTGIAILAGDAWFRFAHNRPLNWKRYSIQRRAGSFSFCPAGCGESSSFSRSDFTRCV
jgi:hypothetical protein